MVHNLSAINLKTEIREHERIPFKTPNKNAHIEGIHRLLEDKCLSRYKFRSYIEAYEAVSEYIKSYNKVRIHSSLGYISPVEFYKRHWKEQQNR
ncbi:integrase core domain-containing protein [Schnuerera ultunensis]|uniref:Integrase catalytic domain-containing protein n=1 Tax=[Clostridium] ultunense Esp TaxID=1288971 RepID=A0A1M4PKH9_9FIRM|nr:integrase core domain-containing protein [Schnuerera ultunensis]SHD75953.1 protein of unknown function [[Clostridium] ultunense Esp]